MRPAPVARENDDVDLYWWRGSGPAEPIPHEGMRPADVDRRSDDVDLYWWRGPGVPEPEPRGGVKPVDDYLYRIPTAEEVDGDDPQMPLWLTGSCPPWNCPPFWSKPIHSNFEACVATYEDEVTIGRLPVGEMDMAIIRSISYHLEGLQQYELFEIKLYRQGTPRVVVEDMLIDPTTVNPSQRYAFAGDVRPLPVRDLVDRGRTLRITAKIRGLVDLAGNSNKSPGDPIAQCNVRVTVNGWTAPIRRNVDGGPRPVDLGNMGFVPMEGHLDLEGR